MPIPSLQQRNDASWRKSAAPSSKKRRRNKNRKNFIRRLISFLFFAAIILGLVLTVYAIIISRRLPNPNQLINRDVAQSTKIYDRTGQTVLYEISGD